MLINAECEICIGHSNCVGPGSSTDFNAIARVPWIACIIDFGVDLRRARHKHIAIAALASIQFHLNGAGSRLMNIISICEIAAVNLGNSTDSSHVELTVEVA